MASAMASHSPSRSPSDGLYDHELHLTATHDF